MIFFWDFFSRYLPNNTYNTRGLRINLPPVRTDTDKRFAVYRCCLLLRELPDDLLVPQSSLTLKRKYKAMILSTY